MKKSIPGYMRTKTGDTSSEEVGFLTDFFIPADALQMCQG
jgi:hypothetical protein